MGSKVQRSGVARTAKDLKRLHKRPCRSAPATPTGVTVSFQKHWERKAMHWDARVKWDAVTLDVAGRTISVEAYQVQLRATDASGVPLQTDGADHDFWRQMVPDDDRRVRFQDLPRPKTYYYQARVRVLNRIHGGRCWSAWSGWTAAQQAAGGALTGPPAPTGLALNFDKVEAAPRGTPWRGRVLWNRSADWTPTDGDPTEIESYGLQIEVRRADGTVINRRRNITVDHDPDELVQRYEFLNARGRRSYRVRIKARALGRTGAWTAYTAWLSPGGDPAPPTSVETNNPTPRKIVVKWTEPSDLTDVDQYRVRIYRNPATVNVLVEEAYVGVGTTRYNWNIPLAEATDHPSATYRGRVVSLEAPVSDEIDDGAAGFDAATTSATVEGTDVVSNATWSVTEAPGAAGSDGSVPTSHPTVTATGGPTFIAAKWAAISNPDPVTYDVYISATDLGATVAAWTATTKYASLSGTAIVLKTLANGTALSYGTTYFVAAIARDADGTATAALPARGSAAMVKIVTVDVGAGQITAAEIAANTITANEIAANAITSSEILADAVTAAKIDVATLSAISADLGTVTAGSYATAASGTRWVMSSAVVNELQGFVSGVSTSGKVVIAGSPPQILLVSPFTTSADQASLTLLTQASPTALWVAAEQKLSSGYQARGYCAVRASNSEAGTRVFGSGVTYGGMTQLTNTPSSVTFTTVGTDSNVTAVAAADVSTRGFRFDATISANLNGAASRTYVTVGN